MIVPVKKRGGLNCRSHAMPPDPRHSHARPWFVVLLLLATGTVACRPSASEQASHPARQVELKLFIVDDPGMCEAIERLQAEWKARTGSTVVVEQISADALIAGDAPTAGRDAVIYPAAYMGSLAQANAITPLPADYAANDELAWSDTFELAQVAETRWGQTPWAVSFGSALLTCYYRADLFDKYHKRPPQTWSEYHELCEFFSKRENLAGVDLPDDWAAAIEPLASPWAGRVLLARAAAYAKHRDHYSTLFKIDNMEPLVAGPPFVRALEEMIADEKLGPQDRSRLDPWSAGQRFLDGKSALALAIPTHASLSAAKDRKPPAIAFAELPGSAKVYSFASASWENRKSDESSQVPLLGFTGRLGSIAAQSAQPAGAFQLLAWLSGKEWGTAVSTASTATSLYRRSQLVEPRPWVDPQIDAQAARQFAEVQRDALSRQAYLSVPRLPGHDKYMAALDVAVQAALSQEKPASEALAGAAEGWRNITAQLGIAAQRAAYRQSLGLEP